MNKLEQKIYWIFIISLIIDNINGILLLNNIELPISIGQIYRNFMIILFLFYILKSKDRNIISKIICSIGYLGILTLIYFSEHCNIGGFLMDVTYAAKLIFPFIIMASIYILSKQGKIKKTVIEKIFETFSIIVPLTLIIPRIFNIGYDSYLMGGGYKGFYYSNNEINVVLICTFIYSMERLYKNKKITDIIISIINAAALFLIGSKTSIIVIAMIIMIYIVKMRNNRKWFIGIVTVTILAIVIGCVLFASQIKEMSDRFEYYYDTLSDNGGILTFIMSTRNLRIIPAFEKNILDENFGTAAINLLFGIGRYQQFGDNNLNNLMELDFFDTFYWYGIITAIVVLKGYLSIFIKALKNKEVFEYKLMFSLVFLFSMIAGHVWFSALSGGIFSLVCLMLIIPNEQEEEKTEE